MTDVTPRPLDPARGERYLERLRGYLAQSPRLGPETVHIDVTNGCNLNCVTCWSYAPTLDSQKSAAWKRERIDRDFFFRVLDEVTAIGVDRIVLSGAGDPFTHPDIEDFVAAVKGRGLKLTLITNGTLCNFDTLRTLKVDQVLLNVASSKPETYVAYHPGQPLSTFDRLMEGCRTLRDVTSVNHVQVINALNATELVQMIDLAHSVGARCSFKVGDLPKGTEQYGLNASQKAQLLTELIPAARKRARALGVKHNLDAYQAALEGKPLAELPCFSGYLYARVAVDGQVYFCCAHLGVGHLAKGSFEQVWNGPEYSAMRARLHRGEGFDACKRCGKHDMNFSAARDLKELFP